MRLKRGNASVPRWQADQVVQLKAGCSGVERRFTRRMRPIHAPDACSGA